MKNKIILVVTFIVILVVIGVTGIIKKHKNNEEEKKSYKYEIVYYDESIPGSKSNIVINNNKITITTTYYCSAVDCKSSTETNEYNYTDDNLEKLVNFIKNNFEIIDNKVEIHENELDENQQQVMIALLISQDLFDIMNEEYKYKIEYLSDNNTFYYVFFKEDNSIIVKKMKMNDSYSIESLDTYKLNFNKSNIDILFNYVENELKNKDTNVTHKNTYLRKDETPIFNSIMENKESYLNNYNIKLNYTIKANKSNCAISYLYLYNDNTYEYFYSKDDLNNSLTPLKGYYNSDIKSILEEELNSKIISDNYYLVTDQDKKTYIINSNNIKFSEFLKNINVDFNICY